MSASPKTALGSAGLFDAAAIGTRRFGYQAGERLYAQGDEADSVLYIEHGAVKMSYVSYTGKERVMSVLKAGEFLGTGCIAGRKTRRMTAMAITACSVLRIEKPVIIDAVRNRPDVADRLISVLIDQSNAYQQSLMSHLFHSSEERLARTLLQLASLGEVNGRMVTLPKMTHETLAAMVGTTRPRVSTFMAKLQRRGLVEFDGQIRVAYTRLKLALGEHPDAPS